MSDFANDLAALEWQIELGADEAQGDAPVNRYALETKPAVAKPVAAEAEVVPQTPDEAPDIGSASAALASAAGDLDALAAAIAAFDGCALKKGARNTVFSDGNRAARVMIIGEAPGRDEDLEGRPFVGRSGQLLDAMFAAIGLSRSGEGAQDSVYITNVLPWRPPQNRDPSSDEITMMQPFLDRHITLKAPQLLVTMGNAATKTVLDTTTGITRMRGAWTDYNGIPLMPMFHPEALLRNPLQKREAWEDLRAIREKLDALA
jgi:DNA polymerase